MFVEATGQKNIKHVFALKTSLKNHASIPIYIQSSVIITRPAYAQKSIMQFLILDSIVGLWLTVFDELKKIGRKRYEIFAQTNGFIKKSLN